jgi:hypothetical protein
MMMSALRIGMSQMVVNIAEELEHGQSQRMLNTGRKPRWQNRSSRFSSPPS